MPNAETIRPKMALHNELLEEGGTGLENAGWGGVGLCAESDHATAPVCQDEILSRCISLICVYLWLWQLHSSNIGTRLRQLTHLTPFAGIVLIKLDTLTMKRGGFFRIYLLSLCLCLLCFCLSLSLSLYLCLSVCLPVSVSLCLSVSLSLLKVGAWVTGCGGVI